MLGRPYHVDTVAESLAKTTKDYRLLFIASEHDTLMLDKLERSGHEFIVEPEHEYGDYAKKINAGYRYTDEPLLFLGAGDLLFHENWLENAMSRLSDTIHVVGTNDLANEEVINGRHSTHSLVTREYVDRWGTITTPGEVLCERYWHEYVDNEFVETAKMRDAFTMAMDSLVEHMHPIAGKAQWDALYEQTWLRMQVGEQIYQSRRHMWT